MLPSFLYLLNCDFKLFTELIVMMEIKTLVLASPEFGVCFSPTKVHCSYSVGLLDFVQCAFDVLNFVVS